MPGCWKKFDDINMYSLLDDEKWMKAPYRIKTLIALAPSDRPIQGIHIEPPGKTICVHFK